jgi:hypothetical protein
MKEGFSFPTIVLIILFAACTNQSQEDKLATRLAESKNFIALELSSVKMANEINAAKKDTALMNKYKNLDTVAKRDSILKNLFHTDRFTNNSFKMAEAAKNVSQEFPELAKLSKEAKRSVWKKAAAIVLANQTAK